MFITNEMSGQEAKEYLFSGRSDLPSTLSLDGCSRPSPSGPGHVRAREIDNVLGNPPLRAGIDPATTLFVFDQPVHLSRKAHNPIVNPIRFPRINGVPVYA